MHFLLRECIIHEAAEQCSKMNHTNKKCSLHFNSGSVISPEADPHAIAQNSSHSRNR